MSFFSHNRIGGAAALLALALSRAVAGPIPATIDKPVTITFYDYNLAAAGVGNDGTKQLLDEFHVLQPNITVNAVGVAAGDLTSRVVADIAARRAPDIAQMIFGELDFIVHNLNAQPLEDFVPKDELANHFAGMTPAGLKLGFMDGKTYAMAFTFSTQMLFYNADIFRAAGLDPDKPPRNWADVKQDALQIKAKTGKAGIVGLVGNNFPQHQDWITQAFILSNGGRVLSEDRRKLTFGSPESVEAIGMLRDLVKSGASPALQMSSALETMLGGNAGMIIQSSAVQASLLTAAKGKFEVRAVGMPSFGEKTAHPTNSGSALVILTSDPLKQRAAWELEKFLTSERGYTIITSKIGYLPLRPGIVDDPKYLGEWTAANPMIRPNLAQLERMSPWQSMPGPNYKQITNIFTSAVDDATQGDSPDVAAVMRAAEARAQELMPR